MAKGESALVSSVEIIDLHNAGERQRVAAADVLFAAFRDSAPTAWPTSEAARQEVAEALAAGRLVYAAVDDEGTVLGWIGGIPQYGGRAWELHPLVVRPDVQRRGIGRALVARLEAAVARRGGGTLFLGADDEAGLTSLAGVDLFPGVLAKLASLRDIGGHPFAFYERCGFEVVGVVPDANGFGQPDILMAKRVGADDPRKRGRTMTNGRVGCFLVFLAATAVGCVHAPAPASTDYPCLTPGPEWDGSLWWQRVRAYPGGFGGWFRGRMDGRGKPDKMNVYFLDPKRGIKSLHADHPTSIYNILQGQYTILQLHSCLKAMRDNPSLSELGSYTVDQAQNRIVLIVWDTTIADSIQRIIRRSNVVPQELVIIRKMKMGFIR
jgi:aminoglycoside 6'-N-acetyltransferase I